MVRYAVWIEVDKGEWDYAREPKNGSWSDSSPVKLFDNKNDAEIEACLLYTSPSPRDRTRSRMPSSA